MFARLLRGAATSAAACLMTAGCAMHTSDGAKAEDGAAAPTAPTSTTAPTAPTAPTPGQVSVNIASIKVPSKAASFVGLTTAVAQKREIEIARTLPGQVEPDVGKEVDVSCRVPGRLDQIFVRPGQMVEKGQLLAMMTSREVSDLEAQAVAGLAKLETVKAQEAREREIYNEQIQSPKALIDATTAVTEASVRVNLDASQFNRQKLLFSQKIGAEKDLLAAQAAYAQAEVNLEHAKANLKREERLYKNRSVLRGPYQLAQAERIRAEKELQALKSQLKFLGVDTNTLSTYLKDGTLTGVLKLTAPARGVISLFDVDPGELVVADKPMFRIIDMSTVLISADVPESEIKIGQIGNKMKVQVAGEDKPYAAAIDYVSSSVDHQTRTFAVRARLKNPTNRLKPGMFANVTLEKNHTSAIAVPKSSIQTVDGRTLVFIKSGEAFVPRDVIKGVEGEEFVEITKGLNVGDVVAAQGSLMLKTQLGYGQSSSND